MAAAGDRARDQTKPYTKEDKKKGIVATAAIGGYVAIGVMLAFFTPDDILEQPWAAAFVGWTADFIPQIAKAGIRSPIPDVAQFYSAVMWLLAPIVFIVLLRSISEYGLSQGAKEIRKHKWFMLFAVVIFIPVAIYHLYAEPGDGMGRISRAMLTSRTGLALLHSMTFVGVPIMCGIFVSWFLLVPKVYFSKNPD